MSILAAVDENTRSRTVVEIAADLAKTYDDTLVALHVVPDTDFESHKKALESLPKFHDYSLTQEAESAKLVADEFVMDAVDDFDTAQFEARGRVGDVADEILAEASDLEPRFLVLSGRRQSPAGKAIFGNTAQRVLLNAECPVVTKLRDE